MVPDCELLRQYGEGRCEAAFTELVQRHINMVYSAARRQAGGDADLARDVTQRVFMELAQKARSLPPETVLTGWLYTRTRFAATKAVRTEKRWRAREEKAMEMLSPENAAPEPTWEDLQPVLDAAMHELNERDRNAVLLRYFEGRPLAEVGDKLGLSEDAARMRVGRALEKLRELLARRGVTSTAAALSILLTQQTINAAPAGLALNIAGAALASATTTNITLATLMATTKLKFTLVGAAVIALATPLALQHQSQMRLRAEAQALREQNAQLAQLSAENARLSKMVAQASGTGTAPVDASIELLKLRGEVARLRDDSRELARLKAAAENRGHDPSIEATLQTLAARATQLKKHLEQSPQLRIPELQLISDKEWIDAVAKRDLLNEDDYRQALNRLRSSAKGLFGSAMQKALRQYVTEHGGMLPGDISQLQPYFDPPADPAMLQRYQVTQSGNVNELSAKHRVISETASPVDDEHDTRFTFGLHGTSSESVSRGHDAIEAAARAYAAANNGFLPREASQISPYLREPVDTARIQKFLGKIPPEITRLDQIERR